MNKQDAMYEIETIRARLSELERIVQEEERPQGLWSPAYGERYHFICDRGDITHNVFSQHPTDLFRIQSGNCFPTRESSEKAAPLFARAHKIIQAALMVDPDAGLWANDRLHTVVWRGGRWVGDSWTGMREQGYSASHPAHVHTKAQAEHMAAILNAEGV